MNKFTITHKDKKSRARVGILHTKKKAIETPFFMPVATKASVKFLSSENLKKTKTRAIISNAFFLWLKPGCKVIKEHGGIGKFMHFSGINATDSGGFQMYSKEIYINSREDGVLFKNPYNGKKIFMTPEKNMEIQLDLNSEIAMCLDSMPLYKHSKREIKEAVRKTSLWAERCKKHHEQLQKSREEKRQLLFGIMQGGIHPDLRKSSAKELLGLDFDGYAIGGLGLGEPRKDELRIIELQKKFVPEDKPVYLMGIGTPNEIVEAVSRGIDIFDSRFPTQNARRGTLFTSEGKLRLFNAEYKNDRGPLDKNCLCAICKNYSRAYIRQQLLEDTGTGKQLATFHNIYYINKLLENARNAIKSKKFNEFKKKIIKTYKEDIAEK